MCILVVQTTLWITYVHLRSPNYPLKYHTILWSTHVQSRGSNCPLKYTCIHASCPLKYPSAYVIWTTPWSSSTCIHSHSSNYTLKYCLHSCSSTILCITALYNTSWVCIVQSTPRSNHVYSRSLDYTHPCVWLHITSCAFIQWRINFDAKFIYSLIALWSTHVRD